MHLDIERDVIRHGTGHGVGHYLNVHEGPHGIGVRIGMWNPLRSGVLLIFFFANLKLTAYNSSPLKVGMTISNEPGYYADGRFGIRLESIVLVREAKTSNNFGDKGYLGFEHVTMQVHPSFILTVCELITLPMLGARFIQNLLI